MYIDDDDGWEAGTFEKPNTTYDRLGSTRRFGIELEFDELPNDALEVEEHTIFGAKEDGSVNGGEFVSPILYGDDGLEACEDFCDLARLNEFEVGDNCGFHLHCEVPEEGVDSFKRAILAYHYTYDFWKGTSSIPNRRNDYCDAHKFGPEEIEGSGDNQEGVKRWTTGFSRYAWFNVAAYHRFGTIEIRVHEGTRDQTDVVNWVIAHARFIDAVSELSVGQITRLFGGSKKPSTKFRSIRTMLMHPEVSEHLEKRYALNH